MLNVIHDAPARIIVGVDTHKDVHVGYAIDMTGRSLGSISVPTSTFGFKTLESWAVDLGMIEAFGIEGTSSYGAGLCRHLQSKQHRVVEVNRPDRSLRRHKGKTDAVDAESAARTVLAGTATSIPKRNDDVVEMIRQLQIVRSSAVKSKTAAANLITSFIVTAPQPLREQFVGMTTIAIVRECVRLRPNDLATPTGTAKFALRSAARRFEDLEAEIKLLDEQLKKFVTQAAPTMTQLLGVGVDVAATLLVAAGQNPERLKNEASFAALCGVSPVSASSGKTSRHRLNRGGNRQANKAIHTIVLTRLYRDEQTKIYVARRTAEGKTKREIIRCLKRYIAREIHQALLTDAQHRTHKQPLKTAA